jgi:hypothetical protein
MSTTEAAYFYIEPAAVNLTEKEVATFVYGEEEVAAQLTDLVHERALTPKRGDIIGLIPDEERYRNDGCFIFDGSKVIPLDNSIDDYGAVPPSIQVSDTEFSITHWRDVVGHNCIFWLAQPILDRMTLHWDSEKHLYIGSTIIGSAQHACIIRPADEKYLIDILEGRGVPPIETPEKVLADLRAGKYYFDLNEGDLDCIDWDYQPAKMFYAIPKDL